MPPAAPQPGKPYCSNCGYDLTGATETAVCPECGRPLVEVLVRGRVAVTQKSKRYRSEAVIFGLPVLDIALGPDPAHDEPFGRARGIIAIGDRAVGGFAFGHQHARGVIAVGGTAIGGVAVGGASVGVIGLGGAAAGGLALGGGAAGGIAMGGGAVGLMAQGGLAIGYYARGGGVVGVHTVGPMGPSSQHAADVFSSMAWLIGTMNPNAPLAGLLTPLATIVPVTLFLAAAIGLVAVYGHRRGRRGAS